MVSNFNIEHSTNVSNETTPRAADIPQCYYYNPYDTVNCRREVCHPLPAQPEDVPAAVPAAEVAAPAASENRSLHPQLQGLVTFIPYPTDSHPVPVNDVPRQELTRVFLGQLPYRVTHMQLAWLCDTIAPGATFYKIETIMKKSGPQGKRLPTGCVHALTRPEHVDYLIACLSRRVLFDDSGIWFAQNADEQAQLQSYCDMMKHNEHMRFRDRPYQPVVVQMATSSSSSRSSKRKARRASLSSSGGCSSSQASNE